MASQTLQYRIGTFLIRVIILGMIGGLVVLTVGSVVTQ